MKIPSHLKKKYEEQENYNVIFHTEWIILK